MTETTPSRRRRRQSGRTVGEQLRGWLLGPAGALLLVAGLGGYAWFRQQASQPPQAEVLSPVQQSQALAAVETFPDQGRDHVAPGQPVEYDSEFPTSGPHDPNPVTPGVYEQEQRPEMLVHSLEHGHIVIYYDKPDAAVMESLKRWAAEYPGVWDGVVVTPKAGLGKTVMLTAWTKKLQLDMFDDAAAAAFIDAYRGRGPENPVR